MIDDLAFQCDSDIERVECDALYNDLALEMWRDHPTAERLAEVIALYAAERQRHLDSLAAIRERLDELIAQTHGLDHVHLDPPEAYRVLVRDRVFPDEPVP